MSTSWRVRACGILLLAASVSECHAVELKVSRDALERTLKTAAFQWLARRYYLK